MIREEIKFWGWAILTLFAIVAGFSLFWKTVGWMTPSGHEASVTAKVEEVDEEMHDEQQAVLSAITALSIKADVKWDAWDCDENEEELIDLLKAQAVNDTIERRVKIEQVRGKMNDLDCTRFED